MKMMVKLAVLLATLLLLTGVSFADFCQCYEVNATDLDNAENSCTRNVAICFDFGPHAGLFITLPPGTTRLMVLSLFFEGLNPKMTGALALDSGAFQFHGDPWFNVVTGEYFSSGLNLGTRFCGSNQPHRYKLSGHVQEDCGVTSQLTQEEIDSIVSQTNALFNIPDSGLFNNLEGILNP